MQLLRIYFAFGGQSDSLIEPEMRNGFRSLNTASR
jgi:hypothetical protein